MSTTSNGTVAFDPLSSDVILGEGHVEIRFLHRDRAEDWAVFPYIEQRIQSYAARLGETRSAAQVLRTVAAYWAVGSNTAAVWAVLQDGKIVGHAVVGLINDGDMTLAFCWQAEIDVVDQEATMATWEIMKAWARWHGCTILRCETPRSPEAFMRRYGLEHVANICEAKL